MDVPLVMAVRVGCRKTRAVPVDELHAGDRLILGDTGVSIRVEEVECLPTGIWRVRGNDGWDVAHVVADGTILELAG